MIRFLKDILFLLKSYNSKGFYFVLVLSIFISLIELIGVSIIMPFISIASDFHNIHNTKYLENIYEFFSFHKEILFIIIIGVLLILFYVFRFFINIFFTYSISKFSYNFYKYIVTKLYRTYLSIFYKDFIKYNSTTFSKAIISEAQSFTFMLIAVLQMISEIFVVIFIYTFLLLINFQVTLYISLGLMIIVFLIMKVISKKIKIIGIQREKSQKKIYEILHATFGNYKILKLYHSNQFIIYEFIKNIDSLVHSNIIYQSLSIIPKYLLELIGFSLIIIVILIYIYITNDNIQNILPLISLYVLSMYRLLPSISRILTGYNSLLYAHKSYDIIKEHLNYKKELLGTKSLNFNKVIIAKEIVFSYKDKKIINKLNLQIKKGDKVAFIGPSGSGKSTIVDVLIGLLYPDSGEIRVDNCIMNVENIVSYRSKIGYIPQQVYLFDGSVKDNIVLGSQFDENKLIRVLKQVHIYDFLQQKNGIYTKVGEGGNLLSGGQKQRIAIARALYHEPEILVLDEATSALDIQTEEIIMDNIYEISKDRTLIIIAHRLSTIEKCNKIYKVENGRVINVK